MLMYRDFVPRQIQDGAPEGTRYESFEKAVHAAREFLEGDKIELVQIETVVLPNIHRRVEEGSNDPSVEAGGGATWHQFVRVWFRAPA